VFFAGSTDLDFAFTNTAGVGQDCGLLPDDDAILTARGGWQPIPVAATAIGASFIIFGQTGAVVDLANVSVRAA